MAYGFNRMLQYGEGAVIKYAGNAYLRELIMGLLGIVVWTYGRAIPEQDFYFDSFAYCIAQYCQYREIMCTPEMNILLR